MYHNTITLFNYHKATGKWYPSVISGVDLIGNKASTATKEGVNNGDAVDIIIHCTKDRIITTSEGAKSYTGAKAYAQCNTPAACITFAPEQDFIYEGEWPDLSAITDDEYESGLYHAMNDTYDGVYLVSSAAYFDLLPHFEIGGR